jgi:hypothetical protein
MFSIAVTIAAIGGIYLVVGMSKTGWRLVGLSVLLTLAWPFIEPAAAHIVRSIPTPRWSWSSGLIVLLLLIVTRRPRRAQATSDKRRVERD